MHFTTRMFAVTLAIVSLFVIATPAVGNAQSPEGNGGPIPLPEHELIVTKIVEGPVPPGTEFEVEVDCTELLKTETEGAGAEGQTFPVTLTFDEEGGSQSVDVPFFTDECTATETADGGASSVVYGSEDQDCETTATDTDVTANYLDNDVAAEPSGGQAQAISCEVTITNTFEPEPEPVPEPEPAAAAVTVVQATPTFTG